ncbi:hypothetical protein ACS0TY_001913 [Phlomoides rotata]
MAPEALYSLVPSQRRAGPHSLPRSKRSKRSSDEEYLAGCLVALAESGDDASSPTANGASKPSQPPAPVDSYKCSVCGSAFPSHQALGGHKSSHRSKLPAAASAEAPIYTCGPHPTGGFHQCSTCGRRFATGQALGGHMRKHYGGVIGGNGGRKISANSSDGGNGDDSSVVTSFSDSGDVSYSGGDGDLTLSPRNFDLNLPHLSPELDLTLKL